MENVKTGRCDSCEIMYINGVRCHEIGCPAAWKDEKTECKECGREFVPEERYQIVCSEYCANFYFD